MRDSVKVRVAVGGVSVVYDGKSIIQKRIRRLLAIDAALNAGTLEPPEPSHPLGFTGEIDPDRSYRSTQVPPPASFDARGHGAGGINLFIGVYVPLLGISSATASSDHPLAPLAHPYAFFALALNAIRPSHVPAASSTHRHGGTSATHRSFLPV